MRITGVSMIWIFFLMVKSGQAICRFGPGKSCAFPCYCDDGCDEESGACINGGRCPYAEGTNDMIRRHGAGCLIGNIALGRPAYQIGGSSPASRAVDGDVTPDVGQGKCAQVDSGKDRVVAGWYVSLGDTYRITNFTIFTDTDGFIEEEIEINIGNSSTLSSHAKCDRFSGSITGGSFETFDGCSQTGRYLSISKLEGSTEAQNMTLCEVVVMGYKPADCSICRGSCDDLTGCISCQSGKKYPDCKNACDYGYWGNNCEETCASHCASGSCDAETGTCSSCDVSYWGNQCEKKCGKNCKISQCEQTSEVCTKGCTAFTSNNVWSFGDTCDVELPYMRFDGSDTVPLDPFSKTLTSVTWRWREGQTVAAIAEQYVGYYLWYRAIGKSTWTKAEIRYKGADQWQTGTVQNLQPDQSYEFDISAFREFGNTYYENANEKASDELGRFLNATPQTPLPTTESATSPETTSQLIDTTQESSKMSQGTLTAVSCIAALSVVAIIALVVLLVLQRRGIGLSDITGKIRRWMKREEAAQETPESGYVNVEQLQGQAVTSPGSAPDKPSVQRPPKSAAQTPSEAPVQLPTKSSVHTSSKTPAQFAPKSPPQTSGKSALQPPTKSAVQSPAKSAVKIPTKSAVKPPNKSAGSVVHHAGGLSPVALPGMSSRLPRGKKKTQDSHVYETTAKHTNPEAPQYSNLTANGDPMYTHLMGSKNKDTQYAVVGSGRQKVKRTR